MIPIFIGGTGRCGTSILAASLGRHPQITDLGSEIRWLADPEGLAQFWTLCTKNYSPFVVDKALKRLEDLLFNTAPSKYDTRFANACSAFTQFKASITTDEVSTKYYGIPYLPVYWTQDDPQLLRQAIQSWVTQLCRNRDPSATHFVDDTPDNVWAFSALKDIWPDSIRIHVYRHPLDAVASIRAAVSTRVDSTRWWWPGTVIQIAKYVRQVHDTNFTSHSATVKLEKLVDTPRGVLGYICDLCGLDMPDTVLEYIDPERHNRDQWKTQLDKQEKKIAISILEPLIKDLGYDLS